MRKIKIKYGQLCLNLFFALLCMCYIIPVILLLSVSFDGASSQYFSLIPKEFSTAAYQMVFKSMGRIIDAYAVTIFYSVTGVGASLVVMSMFAYALSRPNFKLRSVLSFILFFTTLFGGGLVPTYLVFTNLLHINDTIWIYIVPMITNAWNVIVIRTYFQNLPHELFESARMDGASELYVCFKIVIPLSTPVLASVGFLRFIDAWNNWQTSAIYIRDPKLVSLQYLLKQILDSVERLTQMIESGKAYNGAFEQLANMESMRFAMAVVGVGPMFFLFPFFQKYFAKGMVVGSVKG